MYLLYISCSLSASVISCSLLRSSSFPTSSSSRPSSNWSDPEEELSDSDSQPELLVVTWEKVGNLNHPRVQRILYHSYNSYTAYTFNMQQLSIRMADMIFRLLSVVMENTCGSEQTTQQLHTSRVHDVHTFVLFAINIKTHCPKQSCNHAATFDMEAFCALARKDTTGRNLCW